MDMPGIKLIRTSGDLWGGIVLREETLAGQITYLRQHEGHRLGVNLSPPATSEIKRPGIGWRKYVYTTGAFGVVPYGEVNIYKPYKDQHIVSIHLEPGFLDMLFDQAKINLVQHRGVADPVIYGLVNAMRKELQNQHFVGRIYGESLTHALALHLATHYSDKKDDALFMPRGKLSAGQLKDIIDYCYERRESDLSLADLAAQVHLSPFHFSRLFKQTIGCTPCGYIHQLKIDQAKRLIRQKKMPLTAIAYQLGFSDQAHFCRAFKKATGVSPRKF